MHKLNIGPLAGTIIILLVYPILGTWLEAYSQSLSNVLLSSYGKYETGKTKMATDDEAVDLTEVSQEELLELEQSVFKALGDLSRLADEAPTSGRLTILLRHKRGMQVTDGMTYSYSNDLEGNEWAALFRDVLNCPMNLNEPYTPGDNLDERHERFRLMFQQALEDYSMLGRIWDTYIDITYESDEVDELRAECLRVIPIAANKSNHVALEALNKLINACDEALKVGASLVFTSD